MRYDFRLFGTTETKEKCSADVSVYTNLEKPSEEEIGEVASTLVF